MKLTEEEYAKRIEAARREGAAVRDERIARAVADALDKAAEVLGTGPTMRWLYERESADWWGDRSVAGWLRERAAALRGDDA